MSKHPAGDAHREAKRKHEQAAQAHDEAARAHDDGQHEVALKQAIEADNHAAEAREASNRAAGESEK